MSRCLGILLISSISLLRCFAQDAALPPNYKVVLEENFARVVRVRYAPHEKVPVHTHPETPTIYVYLNDGGPVRFTHYEDPPFSLVRPPTHKGAFRVSKGRMERHTAENLGDTESVYLRVELPGFQMGDKDLDFRGKAPADLSHSLTATEFSAAGLSVVRILCVGPKPCQVAPGPAPSVIIALSDVGLVRGEPQSSQRVAMHSGDVLSVRPRESFTLGMEGEEGAHILQINIGDATAAKP